MGLWAVTSLLRNRPVDLRERTQSAARAVEGVLADSGITPDRIERADEGLQNDGKAVWLAYRFKVDLPPSVETEDLERELASQLASRSVTVTEDEEGPGFHLALSGCEFAQIELKLPPRTPVAVIPVERPVAIPHPEPATPTEPPAPTEPTVPVEAPAPSEPAPAPADGSRPRIAIILDDGGYGGSVTESVLALDPGLTLSILPRTPHGASTAREAAAKGFEVLLHMPMESESGSSAVLSPLSVGMAPEQVKTLTEEALAEIAGAAGVNNHEGSKFTGDTAGMTAFMEVLKGRGLCFVDSRTSPLSVGMSTAQSMGIPAAARDVFLDNDSDEAYLRAQFAELIALARKKGSAIGIGHFRAPTVRVLAELLQGIEEREGVDLVHASQLAR